MNKEGTNPPFWSHWGKETFAVFDNNLVSRLDYLNHAVSLSRQLPDHTYAINLCKDRYLFSVAFLAVLLKKQTSLLPPSNAPNSIKDLTIEYPDSYLLGDEENAGKYHRYDMVPPLPPESTEIFPKEFDNLTVKPDHLAVIIFTSGSTGKAKANCKYWLQLSKATEEVLLRFSNSSKKNHAIVSTVPPQHMYGLETTILYPLLGNDVLISGKTFFPGDIKETLEKSPLPIILTTTPVHLKACIQSGLKFPPIDMVISATASLEKVLAAEAESLFNCPVMEIFGSTETGAIASRRTTHSNKWFLFDNVKIKQDKNGVASVKGLQHD
ncbi:MAG: AMP-binding protein, partial [Gammaproteobacteria bacterium]|nr:AMP-binding protein [Gammaproteobacteria bacterium]